MYLVGTASRFLLTRDFAILFPEYSFPLTSCQKTRDSESNLACAINADCSVETHGQKSLSYLLC